MMTTLVPSDRRRGVTLIGVLLLSAACTTDPGRVIPSAVVTGEAPELAATAIVDCFDMSVNGEGPYQTLELVHADDSVIVTGVFGGYGAARWNTTDGHRPTAKEFQETPARLIRPVTIEVADLVRGDQAAAAQVVARGGESGCDAVTYLDDPILVKGGRYLFFLMPISNSDGKLVGNHNVVDAWLIGPDDVVETDSDGPMALPEIIDAIQNGPTITPPPSPGEPPITLTGP